MNYYSICKLSPRSHHLLCKCKNVWKISFTLPCANMAQRWMLLYFHFALEDIAHVVSINHTPELTKADNSIRNERTYNQLPPLSTEQETWVNTCPFLSNTHFVPTGRNHFVRARRQNKMSAADIRYLVLFWFLFLCTLRFYKFCETFKKEILIYHYPIVQSP